jgi:hypothetical protein
MNKNVKEVIALILIAFICLVIIMSFMGKWMNVHIWPWYALGALIVLVIVGLLIYSILWFRDGQHHGRNPH